jgi:hypothetical protein
MAGTFSLSLSYVSVGERAMKIFLTVLAVSTISSIVLWNFGLAHRIWPAHPVFTTTIIAMACGIVTQLLLSERHPNPDRK